MSSGTSGTRGTTSAAPTLGCAPSCRPRSIPPARTLDLACGTGFLTKHLPGEVVGLDQSESMLEEAQRQAPDATFETGDALELHFADSSFERVFTAHFYGHLEEADRLRFL